MLSDPTGELEIDTQSIASALCKTVLCQWVQNKI